VSRAPVRVVGVGNAMRRDDAVGLEVARRLREVLPPGAETIECGGEPVGLLDAWEGAEVALLVDAVSSSGRPGTVHRLDVTAGPVPPGLARGSTHALGLAEAIELGRALARLPARLALYGVEGGRFDAGEGLTPEVARAADRLVEEIRAEVARALAEA
jgi:hydrogenase maturation protease